MKYSNNVYRSMSMITQFGINMVVPIAMCTFIGIFLDDKFGTSYWTIILFFMGAVAGFRNILHFARKIYTTVDTKRKKATGTGVSDVREIKDDK